MQLIGGSGARKARTIVFQQIANDRLHYPYRVAIGFAQFYDAFATALDKPQRDEIARAAKSVLERIEELQGFRQEQRYVEECWTELSRIVEESGIG